MPISLCNVSYRILSKVIANRLKGFFPLIIHNDQTAFLKGHNTHKAILSAQEIVHSMYHFKCKFPKIILKNDLGKTFDTIK